MRHVTTLHCDGAGHVRVPCDLGCTHVFSWSGSLLLAKEVNVSSLSTTYFMHGVHTCSAARVRAAWKSYVASTSSTPVSQQEHLWASHVFSNLAVSPPLTAVIGKPTIMCSTSKNNLYGTVSKNTAKKHNFEHSTASTPVPFAWHGNRNESLGVTRTRVQGV